MQENIIFPNAREIFASVICETMSQPHVRRQGRKKFFICTYKYFWELLFSVATCSTEAAAQMNLRQPCPFAATTSLLQGQL